MRYCRGLSFFFQINAATRESYTYDDCKKLSYWFANVLSEEFSLAKDDVMSVMLPNCPETGFLFTGASLLGASMAPFNPIWTAEEVARYVDVTCPKMIATVDSLAPVIRRGIALSESKTGFSFFSMVHVKKKFTNCYFLSLRAKTHDHFIPRCQGE